MNRLNERLVRLVVSTMIAAGVHNAEQELLLPWLRKHASDPTKANIEFVGRIYKQAPEVRDAIDQALVKAGAPSADTTHVGYPDGRELVEV